MAIQGVSSAFHRFKTHVIQPVLGRFSSRTVAQTKPSPSASVKQAPQPENLPDTSIAKRKVATQPKTRSILKTAAIPESEKRHIELQKKPESLGSMQAKKYTLRNHEQAFLHGLLSNTRPGRVRQFIYKLHLSAPSHPKKEVTEFKAYLKESATSIQQLDEIRDFLKGEKLADCQINRAMKVHRQGLVATRCAEVIVESHLAHESSSGEELKERLSVLLDNPGNIASKLRSKNLYLALASDVGLDYRTTPLKAIVTALEIGKANTLYSSVATQLQKYASDFSEDPEAAQDIIDTQGQFDFTGSDLVKNDWSVINGRTNGDQPRTNFDDWK
ncbi:hypothetical protein EOPP23_08290 [Endozoicomonas sp. OPT23]|uniref:hypothetical protein n=1 Tax=Endozoicomonas sp. OPT23 TaxID=2072845 RepID=UPI00129B9B3B|nr:hypothetical protein [Endozoicomonas sp. OPT23]MRI32983.1 hypothetical protein [Endozoicomonas sp. OPT23]